MSEETSAPRRVLHLVIEGYPAENIAGIVESSPDTTVVTEIFQLTEENAREALGKIFAADTVAVWGKAE
jgi:hypothetical protein